MTNDIIAAFRSVFAGSGDFRSCNVSCNITLRLVDDGYPHAVLVVLTGGLSPCEI